MVGLGNFSGVLFKDECEYPDHQFDELVLSEKDNTARRRTVRSLVACTCGGQTALDIKRDGRGIFLEDLWAASNVALVFQEKIKKAMPFLDQLIICPWCACTTPLVTEVFELENKLELNPALVPPEEIPALYYQALGIYRRYSNIVKTFLQNEHAEMERQKIKDLNKKPKKTLNGFIT